MTKVVLGNNGAAGGQFHQKGDCVVGNAHPDVPKNRIKISYVTTTYHYASACACPNGFTEYASYYEGRFGELNYYRKLFDILGSFTGNSGSTNPSDNDPVRATGFDYVFWQCFGS